MSDITNPQDADALFSALGEQLAAAGARYELVVIGGSGLLALGMIERSTRDVDVVALRSGEELGSAEPLPEPLREARDRVARDFSLPVQWLNAGPTNLLDLGLPEGFLERLQRREYGQQQDLRALNPSAEELRAAARWARTHDPSEPFAAILDQVLSHLGVEDVGPRT